MVILTAEEIGKSYAERSLFEHLSFGINEDDRIGLIGVNGSGKSTLLRILAGLESPDEGRVTVGGTMTVAYLPQNPELDPEQTVLDYLFAADTPQLRLLRRYEETTRRLERAPTDESLVEALHALTAEMDRLAAWEAEANARSVLSRLGIEALDARLGALSGGQRKRVALARSLIDRADLLILDEPTNHIDVGTVAWLEEYLARAPGALLLVTHDRYFLDRVTNRIWELHDGELTQYEGNYESYLAARAARERLQEATQQKQANLLRKEMAWLKRGARARSTKQKAHIRRVEALAEDVESGRIQPDELTIALGSRRLGKRVVEMRDVTFRWGDTPVLSGFSRIFEPGERVGVVGPNGAGKSTLLNLISGRLRPQEGEIVLGETVHLAYYDQESRDLPNEVRVVDYIQEGAQLIRLADGGTLTAPGALEWFLFPREQQYSLIGKLSGGEKRRLYLLRTLMLWPNVLLLDEPTNDLDIRTLTVLEDFLDTFQGTVIAVSHDRYFLDRVADTILVMGEEDGTVREYPGNYSLFREMRQREVQKAPAPERPDVLERGAPTTRKPAQERRLTWKEQRELEQIERRIAELEAQLSQLADALVAAAADYEKVARLQREHEAAEAELEPLLERWMELSEVRETAGR